MKNVDSVIVQYVGGPRDGVVEEITRANAAKPLLIGAGDHSTPPQGWYPAIEGDGKRIWKQGPPSWWHYSHGEGPE